VSNYKVGDKVWVQCEVIEPCESLMKVTGSSDENWFWAGRGQCRPVEPIAKEPTSGQKLAERTMKAIWAANDAVNGTPAIEDPLATKPDSSEIPDSSSEPLLLGDAVELQSNNVWRGTKGILTNWCSVKKAFWFESLDPSRKAINGWMKEQWDDEETGICRLVKIDHPNDSPKPDSSSDPIDPSHYRQGGIECIEAMKVALGSGFLGYLRGNAIKYLWRYDKKNGVEDLKKARWYLDRLVKEVGE
jgi:hypothetical protein